MPLEVSDLVVNSLETQPRDVARETSTLLFRTSRERLFCRRLSRLACTIDQLHVRPSSRPTILAKRYLQRAASPGGLILRTAWGNGGGVT